MNTDTLRSPFLPIMIVFLSLIVLFGFQTRQSLIQHRQLTERLKANQEQQAKFDKVLPSAETVNTTMVNLSKDLVNLSSRSPGAKKIVEDFRIQLTQPNGAPAEAANQ